MGMALPLHIGAQNPAKAPTSPQSDAGALRLQRLKEQWQRTPGDRCYLHDYVRALEDAGRETELLARRPQVDLDSAPASVLARFARAYSNRKQFPHAVEMY